MNDDLIVGDSIYSLSGSVFSDDGAVYSQDGGSWSWNFNWSYYLDGDISAEGDIYSGHDIHAYYDVVADWSSSSDAWFRDLYVSGTKGFIQPHPGLPEKVVVYKCMEGPEATVEAHGLASLSAGSAEVELPLSFRLVTGNEDLVVLLTPYGESNGLFVESVDNSLLVVRERDGGRSGCKFSWQVMGPRRFVDLEPDIQDANDFFQWRERGEKEQAFRDRWVEQWLQVNESYRRWQLEEAKASLQRQEEGVIR